MFDILSIGNSELLIAVLNGLAILTADDGPAGYGGLIALGLLVGWMLVEVWIRNSYRVSPMMSLNNALH